MEYVLNGNSWIRPSIKTFETSTIPMCGRSPRGLRQLNSLPRPRQLRLLLKGSDFPRPNLLRRSRISPFHR